MNQTTQQFWWKALLMILIFNLIIVVSFTAILVYSTPLSRSLGISDSLFNQSSYKPASNYQSELAKILNSSNLSINSKICSEQEQNLKLYFSRPDSNNDVDEVGVDQKFSRGGLYESSKQVLNLHAKLGNTYIYGEQYLNSATVDLIKCTIEHTYQQVSGMLGSHSARIRELNELPTRVLIYDSQENYNALFKATYLNGKTGEVPYALSEGDTISTYLFNSNSNSSDPRLLGNALKTNLIINIAHEYTHRLLNESGGNFKPFYEEGIATYKGGSIASDLLGGTFGCIFKSMQANYLGDVEDLKIEDLTNYNSDEWLYDSGGNQSRKYAIAYYFFSFELNGNDFENYLNRLYSEKKADVNLKEFQDYIKITQAQDLNKC